MRYKLVVSDELEFTARFTLNDRGVERAFGAKLAARRLPADALEAKLKTPSLLARDLLAEQGLAFRGWDGDCPLQDDAGKAPAVDEHTLDDLMGMVNNMPNVVLGAYLEANGAKAKTGN